MCLNLFSHTDLSCMHSISFEHGCKLSCRGLWDGRVLAALSTLICAVYWAQVESWKVCHPSAQPKYSSCKKTARNLEFHLHPINKICENFWLMRTENFCTLLQNRNFQRVRMCINNCGFQILIHCWDYVLTYFVKYRNKMDTWG